MVGGLADGQLLERFAAGDGEAAELAFAVLMERHGPMVLRVCRGVLRSGQDAEDAFQATFLILARKAKSIRERESLGPWLHGVAYNVATTARASAHRRRSHEMKAGQTKPQVDSEPPYDDLGPVVHEELARLPSHYRAAIVLCCLEGLTQPEAAHQLGWPLGTVQSRLARGRRRLREQLIRRGLVPAVTLSSVLLSDAAKATVPAAMEAATVRAATGFAARRSFTSGAVPVSTAKLAQGILRNMLMDRLKLIGMFLVTGTLATGAGVLAYPASGLQNRAAVEKPRSLPDAAVGSVAAPIRSPSDLFAAQSRVGQRAYEQALTSFREGKVDLEKVHLWSRRLMEAQFATATGSYVVDPEARAIHVAAAKAHRDRMIRLEGEVRLRVEKGAELPLSGSTAEYYRLEAEGWVLEYTGQAAPTRKVEQPKP